MTEFRQDLLNANEGEPTAAATVVAEAAARLRAVGHLYFELEAQESAAVAIVVRHRRPEDTVLGEYGAHVYGSDPLTAPFRDRLQRGEALAHGAAIVALGELPWSQRITYENRFLRRAGIADVLGLGVPVRIGGRARMLCFGFHRRPSDDGFTARDKRLLSRLADGLRLRAENLALREALSQREALSLRGPGGIVGVATLTRREREVADLLLSGRGNRGLACELGLTVNTVENHLRSIYAKLGVRSRSEAMARLLGRAPPPPDDAC